MGLKTFGVGRTRRNKKGLNIAAIPNCEFWIDLSREETLSYDSGLNVSKVTDLSGKGRDMTKIGAENETVFPTYDASEMGLQFSNMAFDQMKAGDIGDWNFLHDGTGCTVLVMFKINNDYASVGALLSTSSPSTSGIGMNLYYYNDTQRYRHTVRNGTSLVLSSYGSTNSMPKNQDRILSIHMTLKDGAMNDAVIRSNGTTDFKGNTLSSVSTGDSSGPLFFGKLATGGVFAPKFILKKCAIFSRRLTKREENAILNDWEKQGDITLTKYGQRDLAVLAGQSNAKGRGLISESIFNTQATVANAEIFDRTNFSWSTLVAGSNNDAFDSSSLGVEMNFAKTYTDNTADTLSLVKYAVDSTSITQWLPGTGDFDTLKEAITNAIQTLEDDGYDVNPVSFIWYQGESDTSVESNYTAYEANIKSLVDGLNTIPQFEQTPFTIVEIQQNPYQTGTTTVQGAGIAVSNTAPYSYYTHYIQTDDIITLFDASHVDAVSLDNIGAGITQTLLS